MVWEFAFEERLHSFNGLLVNPIKTVSDGFHVLNILETQEDVRKLIAGHSIVRKQDAIN